MDADYCLLPELWVFITQRFLSRTATIALSMTSKYLLRVVPCVVRLNNDEAFVDAQKSRHTMGMMAIAKASRRERMYDLRACNYDYHDYIKTSRVAHALRQMIVREDNEPRHRQTEILEQCFRVLPDVVDRCIRVIVRWYRDDLFRLAQRINAHAFACFMQTEMGACIATLARHQRVDVLRRLYLRRPEVFTRTCVVAMTDQAIKDEHLPLLEFIKAEFTAVLEKKHKREDWMRRLHLDSLVYSLRRRKE